MKDVRGLVSPFISLLFNKSLSSGYLPSKFKQAVVRPLLKKSGLDDSDLKNFRPVLNLSFQSKLLERITQCRLQLFLDSNDLMPETQSAYRRFHSIETAVTVYNDLLFAADDGQMSALCLLGNGVVLYGTSYRGVAAVDARTDATLSLKKVAKSSAVCSVVSSVRDSPRTP